MLSGLHGDVLSGRQDLASVGTSTQSVPCLALCSLAVPAPLDFWGPLRGCSDSGEGLADHTKLAGPPLPIQAPPHEYPQSNLVRPPRVSLPASLWSLVSASVHRHPRVRWWGGPSKPASPATLLLAANRHTLRYRYRLWFQVSERSSEYICNSRYHPPRSMGDSEEEPAGPVKYRLSGTISRIDPIRSGARPGHRA